MIDLDRLPSHGREVAHSLRQSKALRTVPIVFVGGAEEKVAAIRAELPDATYAGWDRIGDAVRQAVASPPFATSRRELEKRFASVTGAVAEGALWMAWPKRSSGLDTDLSEDVIRDVALAAGMVDTKVCAIDETWSGLRLTRRRSQPS